MWKTNSYTALLNAVLLAKCIHAHVWENSHFVAKQLIGIGPFRFTHMGVNHVGHRGTSPPESGVWTLMQIVPSHFVMIQNFKHQIDCIAVQ